MPYASFEFTVMLEELLVFNLLFGLLPLAIGAVMFASCGMEGVGHLVDPQDDIHRLGSVSTVSGTAVQLSFSYAGGPSGTEGICLVVHELHHGKSGWKEASRRLVAVGGGAAGRQVDPVWLVEDGRTMVIDLDRAILRPELLRPAADEVRWRAMFDLDFDGRVREHCVGPGDRVFVEGCIDERRDGPAHIGACQDRPASSPSATGRLSCASTSAPPGSPGALRCWRSPCSWC